MRVAPSFPQRGRHPKGSIPLTPFDIHSVSIEDFSSTFGGVVVILRYTQIVCVPNCIVKERKVQKNFLAPLCLGEALRRGTLSRNG